MESLSRQIKNPTSIHEDMGSIPGLPQWSKDDPALLWHRPAAVAPIRPLTWELPHVMGVALKKKKKKKGLTCKYSLPSAKIRNVIANTEIREVNSNMEVFIP